MIQEPLYNIWFSPRKILLRYAQKEQEVGEEIKVSSKYKSIREARAVALLLFGVGKIKNRQYWLQLVGQKEQTPDIRVATYMSEVNSELRVFDIEVVTLESHSFEDVDTFLKRTKLSTNKYYPESTIFFCNIDKEIQTKPWLEISREIIKAGVKNDLYVIGRTDPDKLKYQLARLNPHFDNIVKFDVMEEAKKDAIDVMRFYRSSKPTVTKEKLIFEPF
jgi:hypothetical protein